MSKTFSLRALLLLGAFVSVCAHAAEPAAPVAAKQVLKTTASWDGKALAFPAGPGEVTALSIEIQPGAETGWHQHPVPSFAMVLQGVLQVSLRDGRTRRFGPGEAFAEVVNTAHNGRNVGDIPVTLLVFYTGSQGAALTIKDAD